MSDSFQQPNVQPTGVYNHVETGSYLELVKATICSFKKSSLTKPLQITTEERSITNIHLDAMSCPPFPPYKKEFRDMRRMLDVHAMNSTTCK
jgi:hypothetical protein